MEPLLQVRDLSVCYGSNPGVSVLKGLSFEIAAGEALGLLGESGCGKSTLALTLLRLLPPAGYVESGSIIFRGDNLLALREGELQKVRGAGISLVPQEPGLALNPVLQVGDQVAEVLRAHRPPKSFVGARGRAPLQVEVRDLLSQVGFAPERRIDKAYPHQLSGGERQRVVIAQAIACNPALLVADEPTTALDPALQLEILALLKSLREALLLTLLLISHHPGVLARAVDRVLVMHAGQLVEEGPAPELFHNPRHPYTRRLLQSAPKPQGWEASLALPKAGVLG